MKMERLLINKRKRLNDVEEMQSAIFDSVMESIVVFNDEKKIIHCNNATENIFKYSKKELIGTAVSELIEAVGEPWPKQGGVAAIQEHGGVPLFYP